jgi:hypothetical protein
MFVKVNIPKSKTANPNDKTFPEDIPEAIPMTSKANLPRLIKFYVRIFVCSAPLPKSYEVAP